MVDSRAGENGGRKPVYIVSADTGWPGRETGYQVIGTAVTTQGNIQGL